MPLGLPKNYRERLYEREAMDSPEQLIQIASDLLARLEKGRPFEPQELQQLVHRVEAFCEHFPPQQEIPRKVARLLTELVPALDATSQNYGERDSGRIQAAAAELFVVMLERL